MIEEKQAQEPTIEKETNRVEAFSDGVFAVAITLLIFNLNVDFLGLHELYGRPIARIPECEIERWFPGFVDLFAGCT